jgi:hypothetical protein
MIPEYYVAKHPEDAQLLLKPFLLLSQAHGHPELAETCMVQVVDDLVTDCWQDNMALLVVLDHARCPKIKTRDEQHAKAQSTLTRQASLWPRGHVANVLGSDIGDDRPLTLAEFKKLMNNAPAEVNQAFAVAYRDRLHLATRSMISRPCWEYPLQVFLCGRESSNACVCEDTPRMRAAFKFDKLIGGLADMFRPLPPLES